jgi:hypothetical protein
MNQFIRKCELVLSGSGSAISFDNLKIAFTIKRSDTQSPNEAEIKIYNLSDETINRARKEFTEVRLSAGYQENYGTIFDGTIRQVKVGKENGTDNFLHVFCSDGDEFYNNAVINLTMAAGSTPNDHIAALIDGIAKGSIADIKGNGLPRGKVMYGMNKDYLRQVADGTDNTWSIQNGKMQIVPRGGVSNAPAVILNSKSGLIGTPTQENGGIKVRCLINPMLSIGGRVYINQEDIEAATIQTINKKDKNALIDKPASFSSDGYYKLIQVEYVGDTFGNDWYCDLMCLDLDATLPLDKNVKEK